MAKKRVKHNSLNRSRRVAFDNATRPGVPRPKLLPILVKVSGEDHRRYHPNGKLRKLRNVYGSFVVGRGIVGSVPRAVIHPGRRGFLANSLKTPWSYRQVLPADAVVCARRRIRKSVLHALGKTGRGGQRRPRYNENSKLICRR